MPKKRKLDRKRDRSGRIIQEDRGIDRGTPELQALRSSWLGTAAGALPLSHANPVDVLCARGWLTTEHVTAARAYQDAHRIRFGSCSARAAEIGRIRGETIPTRDLLRLCRQHEAWATAIGQIGAYAVDVVTRYVLLEQIDRPITMLARYGSGAELDPQDRMALVTLRRALETVVKAIPVRVTAEEVAAMEAVERTGRPRLRRIDYVRMARAGRAA